MQSKPRPTSPQAVFLTDAEVVANRAKALGSDQAAVNQINAMVRSGRLVRYKLKISDDGTERNEAVEVEPGAGLVLDKGRVSDFQHGHVRFLRSDIERLGWLPPVERSEPEPETGGRVVDVIKVALRILFPPDGLAPDDLDVTDVQKLLVNECGLSLEQTRRDSVRRALRACGWRKMR